MSHGGELVSVGAHAVKHTRQNLAGVDRQALDLVAVVEDDVADVQIGSRLAENGLRIGDRAGAVSIIVGLAVQSLRKDLAAEVHAALTIPVSGSGGVAGAENSCRLQCRARGGREVTIAGVRPESACGLLVAVLPGNS